MRPDCRVFVPPTPILSRDWHYQYMLYCLWCKKKIKIHVFNCDSSAIIHNSIFMLIFCLSCVVECVGVWEQEIERSKWVCISNNILSSAPRFSERMLTIYLIKGTDSIAPYDLVNLIPPQHIHFTEHTHTHVWTVRWGGILENTN